MDEVNKDAVWDREAHPYRMQITLNVLNHLGLNLYSNVPAVLSEIIANSWDADAEKVTVDISPDSDQILIWDNGVGMSSDDVNDKYLTVGYEKRKDVGNPLGVVTPRGRSPMGRKGIGKLSVFSIARHVEVHTAKKGERNSFLMRPDEIEACIKRGETYYPTPIAFDDSKIEAGETGTFIVLKELKKKLNLTAPALRKRVARRFSHLDGNAQTGDVIQDSFSVEINGEPVSARDKDFFNKVEFVWYFGDYSVEIADRCVNAKQKIKLEDCLDEPRNYCISGWVGTVDEQKDFDENDNTIVLFARNKLIQEDILRDFRVAGVYSKYMVGEINAEFLDTDEEPDLVTSDRQRIKEDDERYEQLKDFLKRGVIRRVHNEWGRLRQDVGFERAMQNDVAKEWFESLGRDSKQYAQKMFGHIEKLKVADKTTKAELYKSSIIAFETLAVRDLLSTLTNVESDKDFEILSKVFGTLDELETVRYYQIVKERLEVIKRFQEIVPEAKERVLQEHIFENLWLLHPSWERAATNERIEQSVTTEFAKITAKLSPKEKKGRIDIRYKTAAGKHIIIELKKYDVRPKGHILYEQVQRYRAALEKILQQDFQEPNPRIESICIVGQTPTPQDRVEETERMLAAVNSRFITYDNLIKEAIDGYSDFVGAHKHVKRIVDLVDKLAGEVGTEISNAEPAAALEVAAARASQTRLLRKRQSVRDQTDRG